MDSISRRRFEEQRRLLLYWIKNEITSKEISLFLKKERIDKIAIYGMGEIGAVVGAILDRADVQIEYGIDKNDLRQIGKVKVKDFKLLRCIEDVDAVLVTPFFDFDSICEELRDKVSSNVKLISLEDMVYGSILIKNEEE